MKDWIKQYDIDFSKFSKRVSMDDFNSEIAYNIIQFNALVPDDEINRDEKIEKFAIEAAINRFSDGY
jgi:hypothetical protein